MTDPWREPADETTDLYPGLVVHDGRVTGSITIGRSRLPVWAIIGHLVQGGWGEVTDDWDYIESDYGFTGSDLNLFLYYLMECRGEFGRLLLALAYAERRECDRRDVVLDEATGGEGGLVNVTPGDPDAVELPPAWWEDPELSAPVVDQLRRCLTVLTDRPAHTGLVSLFPTVEGPDRTCVLLPDGWPIGTTVTIHRTEEGQ